MSPIALFLFFKIVLSILGLLTIDMNFKKGCSIFAKKITGMLIGIALIL